MIYVYLCQNGHEIELSHSMHEAGPDACECGADLHRVPQVPMINWNGLKPSQGDIHPNIKRMVEDAPRRREQENDE